MSHSERLPECDELRIQVVEHFKESVPIRDAVKQTKLEVDMLKEQMKYVLPKIQNMTFEVFKAGIVGGLVGSLAGEGLKSALIEIVKLVF